MRQVGRRLTEVTILSRSVVRIWGTLERVLGRHEHSLSRSDRTMRVVHVALDGSATSLIGAFPICMCSTFTCCGAALSTP